MRYFEREHARAKVIIRIGEEESMMKAVVWTKYGDPDGLVLREIEKPVPGGR